MKRRSSRLGGVIVSGLGIAVSTVGCGPDPQPITEAVTSSPSSSSRTAVVLTSSWTTATPVAVAPPVVTFVDGLRFVPLPAGSYRIGSAPTEPGWEPDEEMRVVSLTRPLLMSVTEITQRDFDRVLGFNPSRAKRDDFPVTSVTWDEARQFGVVLTERNPGWVFRLPTEDEWEVASRAGTDLPFGPLWNANSELRLALDRHDHDPDILVRHLGRQARFNADGSGPAGALEPNAWGLHDLHGNVWEWCLGDRGTGERPLRGGAWCSPQVWECRSARRAWEPGSVRKESIGFRVIVEPR